MRRAALRPLVLAAVLVCAAPRAHALDVVLHRFEYVVEPGTTGCPDRDFFRHFIAARIGGRDAISPTAAPRLVLRVWREKQAYRALLSEYDAHGESLGDAPEIHDRTCEEAVMSAGYTAALWVLEVPKPPSPAKAAAAPEVLPPKPKAPEPPEPPSRSETPPEDLLPVPPPKPPPAPRLPIQWRVGAMLRVDATPQTVAAFGVSGDVGIVGPGFSVAAQVHGVPSARSASGLDASLVTGGLVVCWRLDTKIKTLPLVVPLCAIGEAGAIQARQPAYAYDLGHAALSAGGGLRLSVDMPLGTMGFHLSAAVDGLYVVQGVLSNAAGTSTSALVQPSGTVSGAALGAGLGVRYSF